MLCREKNWYSLGFFKLAISTKSSLKSYTCGCIMGNLEVLGLLGSVTECWTATAWKCCLEWQLWGGLCHRGCATLSWNALVLQQHQGCVKHSTQLGFSGFFGCWQGLERPESLQFLLGLTAFPDRTPFIWKIPCWLWCYFSSLEGHRLSVQKEHPNTHSPPCRLSLKPSLSETSPMAACSLDRSLFLGFFTW